MKLINKAYSVALKWLFIIMTAGGIFCYFMIRYINHEETDKFLTHEMNRLVSYHQEFNELPEFNQVADIIFDRSYEYPLYSDTLILEPADKEMVPYRQVFFTLNHNDRNITIVLRQLHMGNDDIMKATLLIIGGLMLLISVVFFIIIRYLNNRLWLPFYLTLDKLQHFRIADPVPVFPASDIDEFRRLNTTAELLLNKIVSDYRLNKEFNENASHELQTQLAIIRNHSETLINRLSGHSEGMREVNEIYNASLHLSKVLKSLLLLSRISNDEYGNKTHVNVKEIINDALSVFNESIRLRDINVETALEDVVVYIDKGLMEILVNNLVKNAIKHNNQSGFIRIQLKNNSLEIENSGPPVSNPESYFGRFAKGNTGATGIGLAIVKEICDKHNFRINYTVDNSVHKVKVEF